MNREAAKLICKLIKLYTDDRKLIFAFVFFTYPYHVHEHEK